MVRKDPNGHVLPELRLSVRCPRCGKPPRLRASEEEVEEKRRSPPDRIVQSYQCAWCDTPYAILAKHFAEAY